jgi:hypothetical protein
VPHKIESLCPLDESPVLQGKILGAHVLYIYAAAILTPISKNAHHFLVRGERGCSMNAPSRCALACLLFMTTLAACTGKRVGDRLPPVSVQNLESIAGTYHGTFSSRRSGTIRESFEVRRDGSYISRTSNGSSSGALRLDRGQIRGKSAGGRTFSVWIYECDGIRILETYWAVLRTPPGYRRAPGDLPGRDQIVIDELKYYYQSEKPIPDQC